MRIHRITQVLVGEQAITGQISGSYTSDILLVAAALT